MALPLSASPVVQLAYIMWEPYPAVPFVIIAPQRDCSRIRLRDVFPCAALIVPAQLNCPVHLMNRIRLVPGGWVVGRAARRLDLLHLSRAAGGCGQTSPSPAGARTGFHPDLFYRLSDPRTGPTTC